MSDAWSLLLVRKICLVSAQVLFSDCIVLSLSNILDTCFYWQRSHVRSRVGKPLNYNNYIKLKWKKSSRVLYYLKLCHQPVLHKREDFALHNAKLELGIVCNVSIPSTLYNQCEWVISLSQKLQIIHEYRATIFTQVYENNIN